MNELVCESLRKTVGKNSTVAKEKLSRWIFRFFTSHKIEKIYITEIYMKKQYKSSITKHHKNIYVFFYGVPLKSVVRK